MEISLAPPSFCDVLAELWCLLRGRMGLEPGSLSLRPALIPLYHGPVCTLPILSGLLVTLMAHKEFTGQNLSLYFRITFKLVL